MYFSLTDPAEHYQGMLIHFTIHGHTEDRADGKTCLQKACPV